MGSNVAPPARTLCMSNGPAITSDSLLANNSRLPARAAANVERRPAAPTMAAMTLCTSGWPAISDERIGATDDARRRLARAQLAFELRRRGAVGERGVRNRETPALVRQLLDVAIRAERDDAEPIRMPRDHVERGLAHRTGGTEDGNADARIVRHAITSMPMSANTSAGAAAVTLSMRSSMPPCPGNNAAAVLEAGRALQHALREIADDGDRGDRDAGRPRTATRRQ